MKTLLKEEVQEIINKIDMCLPKGFCNYKIVVYYKNGHKEIFKNNQELYDYILLKKITDIEIVITGSHQTFFEANGCRYYGQRGFERGIYKWG